MIELTSEKYVVGVDLGGTWLKLALSDEKTKFLAKIRERVDKGDERAIIRQIVTAVRSICRDNGVDPNDLQGVSIASAGPLSMKEGALIRPANLPFECLPLVKPISRELGASTYLINDCTAAVLGERKFGAGQGLENLVYITIGTGIGGGAIIDGHVLFGKDGNAVEIGHITVDFEGQLQCGCGKRGHWEAYCSGRNIPNFVRMRLEETDRGTRLKSGLFTRLQGDISKLSSKDLFDEAKSGDDLSLRLVEEIGVLNAIGFANVINAYDPSLITVGGSVTLKNQKLVLSPIRRYVENYVVNRVPNMMVTPLGEDVGVYGAVAAFLDFKSKLKIIKQ
ncbi:MAG: ROK family protein [Desulfobacterales bacterium]|nr:ROK family protein [Desulfobacterales bacterium]